MQLLQVLYLEILASTSFSFQTRYIPQGDVALTRFRSSYRFHSRPTGFCVLCAVSFILSITLYKLYAGCCVLGAIRNFKSVFQVPEIYVIHLGFAAASACTNP